MKTEDQIRSRLRAIQQQMERERDVSPSYYAALTTKRELLKWVLDDN